MGARARLAAADAASAAAASARIAGDARACSAACTDAAGAYDRAADLFAKAGSPHWAAAAGEGARLRRLQAGMDRATGGLSAAGTYTACLRAGDAAGAARVRAEAGLSARAAAWARARAAGAAKDWSGLEECAPGLPAETLAALAKAAGAPDAVLVRLVGRMEGRGEVLAGLGVRGGGGESEGGGGRRGLFGGR